MTARPGRLWTEPPKGHRHPGRRPGGSRLYPAQAPASIGDDQTQMGYEQNSRSRCSCGFPAGPVWAPAVCASQTIVVAVVCIGRSSY